MDELKKIFCFCPDKAYKATPPDDLRTRIMDSRIAKSEAEWWAKAEIERLETENGRLKFELQTEKDAYGSDVISILDAVSEGKMSKMRAHQRLNKIYKSKEFTLVAYKAVAEKAEKVDWDYVIAIMEQQYNGEDVLELTQFKTALQAVKEKTNE